MLHAAENVDLLRLTLFLRCQAQLVLVLHFLARSLVTVCELLGGKAGFTVVVAEVMGRLVANLCCED